MSFQSRFTGEELEAMRHFKSCMRHESFNPACSECNSWNFEFCRKCGENIHPDIFDEHQINCDGSIDVGGN